MAVWMRLLAGWPATLGLLLAGVLVVWPGRRAPTLIALVACYALGGVHLAAATHEMVFPVHLLLGGLVGALLWLGVPAGRRPAGHTWGGLGFVGALLVAVGAAAVGWNAHPLGLGSSQSVAALWCMGVGALALALPGASGVSEAAGVLLLLLGGELLVLLSARDLDLVAPFAGLHLLLAATVGSFLRMGGGEEARPWW